MSPLSWTGGWWGPGSTLGNWVATTESTGIICGGFCCTGIVSYAETTSSASLSFDLVLSRPLDIPREPSSAAAPSQEANKQDPAAFTPPSRVQASQFGARALRYFRFSSALSRWGLPAGQLGTPSPHVACTSDAAWPDAGKTLLALQ